MIDNSCFSEHVSTDNDDYAYN